MSAPHLAALMIFERNGEILLMRRSSTAKYAAGFYTLPSGRVEDDETLTIAAMREAFEEVGLTAIPKSTVAVHILHRKKNDETWIDGFFCCTQWTGVETNKEPEKCDDLQWFPLDKLPTNMIPFVREVLKRIFNDKLSYSEYGWHEEEI